MNYNAEKTFLNRGCYNPNRKHKIVLFDCTLKENDSTYKFIKSDGREKSFTKSFVISIDTGKTPDIPNGGSFQLDIDEMF